MGGAGGQVRPACARHGTWRGVQQHRRPLCPARLRGAPRVGAGLVFRSEGFVGTVRGESTPGRGVLRRGRMGGRHGARLLLRDSRLGSLSGVQRFSQWHIGCEPRAG